MKDYRHLDVWMKAHKVARAVYQASRGFPKDEIYGLTSQMRRAAIFICANIAEGCGRKSDSELARFLQIARGSASELDYHLLLAHDLKFLSTPEYTELESNLREVQRMLTSLSQRVRHDVSRRKLPEDRVAAPAASA
jgi:four helix bundle protein